MDNGLGQFLTYLIWIVAILTAGYLLFFLGRMFMDWGAGLVRFKNRIRRRFR